MERGESGDYTGPRRRGPQRRGHPPREPQRRQPERGRSSFNANLSERQPDSCAELSGANLTCAELSGANLIKAELFNANLTAADLTRAELSGASLSEADLTDATGLTREQIERAVWEKEHPPILPDEIRESPE